MRWTLGLLCAALYGEVHVDKLIPLGWQRGASVEATFSGRGLEKATGVEFDSAAFSWKTIEATKDKLRGTITIAADAALGPHLLRVRTPDGDSETVMFNAGQFPAVPEKEPNDSRAAAQPVTAFPVEIYGELLDRAETDFYAFTVKAGERLSFDLKSSEIGSYLECKMYLLDGAGKRLVVSDDRSDYDDTPFIDYTFPTAGNYYVQVDQFHGLRAADPKNNPYILRISALPHFQSMSRLGAGAGSRAHVSLKGLRMDTVTSVWLSPVRLAEYYRFTYPHTMPVRARADREAAPLHGKIISVSPDELQAEFDIPSQEAGLYRVWAKSRAGIAEAFQFDISPTKEMDGVSRTPLHAGEAVNAVLLRPRQRDTHLIEAKAGQSLHIYTFAAQFGLAPLDTVLSLRDDAGVLVAENDDIVSGATTMGNPDSSLFYTPGKDGTLHLTVRDRLNRGGPEFSYRLRIDARRPAFQMWTMPDNFSVKRGQTGELTVRMTRDMGFEKEEVKVWVEGLPAGVETREDRFRSDQAWEIGGDGLQMTTPEIVLPFRVKESVAPGRYPIRVLGSSKDGIVVEAQANMIRGPLTNLFNFTRRPLPEILLTVIE